MGPLSLVPAVRSSHTERMAEIVMILAAIGALGAGFVAWYSLWHRRVANAFERVPVSTDRSALVVRRGADLPGNTH